MSLTRQPAYRVSLPVLWNREIVPDIFLLALEEPRLAARSRPGQFLMVSIARLDEPLLPRPFAVFNVEGPRFEILYRRVGKGTNLLSQMPAGEVLNVLGPLGNGFSLPDSSVAALVLAGGIGIASVHLLLLHLLRRGGIGRTALLYGCRSSEEHIPLESLETKGLLIRRAAEDGKRGLKGKVTDLLPKFLDEGIVQPTADTEAFVCGPLPMLKAATGQLAEFRIRAHCSLEARMACGYGVCQGCVIPLRDEGDPKAIRYRKVCTDGPVFPGADVFWEAFR